MVKNINYETEVMKHKAALEFYDNILNKWITFEFPLKFILKCNMIQSCLNILLVSHIDGVYLYKTFLPNFKCFSKNLHETFSLRLSCHEILELFSFKREKESNKHWNIQHFIKTYFFIDLPLWQTVAHYLVSNEVTKRVICFTVYFLHCYQNNPPSRQKHRKLKA